MKLYLNSNLAEGTPEELVKYQELLECKKQSEEETYPTELKVGDRVKVLKSEGGAVGEATVTAVLEGGKVELAGNSKEGSYLSNWSNYISNVEKIEKPASFEVIQAKAYLEDKSIDQVVEEEQSKYKQKSTKVEEEKLMGYTFWYIDGVVPNHLHVLKASIDGYFEDSKGTRYPYQDVHGLVKPIDNAYVREEFEDAKHKGKLLKYYPAVDLFVREY
ncbi:hypothetical protein [Staphylococcus phage PT1-4]